MPTTVFFGGFGMYAWIFEPELRLITEPDGSEALLLDVVPILGTNKYRNAIREKEYHSYSYS
jgi:hypothetical protein